MPELYPDLSNLMNCTLDARQAIQEAFESQFISYNDFLNRLELCRSNVLPLYLESVYEPFLRTLRSMGREEFDHLVRDPWRSEERFIMTEIADAIIQNWGGRCRKDATDAFHEVVSDLYEGFLSSEEGSAVKPPDMRVIPPLVKWGGSDPRTLLVGSTSIFGIKTSIVSLPPSNARHGLFSWATLAHETAGHDILPADIGLPGELAKAIWGALNEEGLNPDLPWYWVKRLDEAASDVIGILNMGPAAGIASIVYLRGLRGAESRDGNLKLNSFGSEMDPHPADVLRGYLAASTVRLLEFQGAGKWANAIWEEANKDLGELRLGWVKISPDNAKASATVVAETLVRSKMRSLENHALGEIQNWREGDERAVEDLRALIREKEDMPESYVSGTFAAHAVAAAVLEALSEGADLQAIFENMIEVLKVMHSQNPAYRERLMKPESILPGDLWEHGAPGNTHQR